MSRLSCTHHSIVRSVGPSFGTITTSRSLRMPLQLLWMHLMAETRTAQLLWSGEYVRETLTANPQTHMQAPSIRQSRKYLDVKTTFICLMFHFKPERSKGRTHSFPLPELNGSSGIHLLSNFVPFVANVHSYLMVTSSLIYCLRPSHRNVIGLVTPGPPVTSDYTPKGTVSKVDDVDTYFIGESEPA